MNTNKIIDIEKIKIRKNCIIPTDARIKNAIDSIKKFGANIPIVVDSRFNLLYGKVELEAFRKLGQKKVPVEVCDYSVYRLSKSIHITESISLRERLHEKVTDPEQRSHIEGVAGKFFPNLSKWKVAMLHDMVEDGYSTLEELKNEYGLNSKQIKALDALTRKKGERYFDYIKRVKENELAKNIKISDIQNNMERCSRNLPKYLTLLDRYVKAYKILSKNSGK